MKVFTIALVLICCVASNVFVSADDQPTTGDDGGVLTPEEIELSKQIQELIDPYAPRTIQNLIDEGTALKEAIAANDLCAATEILQSISYSTKKLLPKITALPYLYQASYNILKANTQLRKQLACNKADIDDVADYYDFTISQLEVAVCKEQESANGQSVGRK